MSELTWDALFERFLAAHTLAPRTVDTYRKRLKAFCLAGAQVADPRELTRKHLETYYLQLLEGPLKEATVAGLMRPVIRILHWASRRGLLLVDPTEDVEVPKPPRPIPRPLNPSEISLLIEATGSQPRRFCRARDRALLELLYGTGIRIGEVEALLLSDLDLADFALTIRISKGRPRRAPFGPGLAAALTTYLEARFKVAQSGVMALFVGQNGLPLSHSSLGHIVHSYSLRTGIPASPHAFRRAFATHLFENGANIVEVKELLGHVDLNSTQLYVQVVPTELTRAYQHSHPRARRTR